MKTANKEPVATANIFDSIPASSRDEVFDLLVNNDNVTIERIVSNGHRSPESGWHKQDKDEWVLVVKGEAAILFEDGRLLSLIAGSHLSIPAGSKHKVTWTTQTTETIWIAVHYPVIEQPE